MIDRLNCRPVRSRSEPRSESSTYRLYIHSNDSKAVLVQESRNNAILRRTTKLASSCSERSSTGCRRPLTTTIYRRERERSRGSRCRGIFVEESPAAGSPRHPGTAIPTILTSAALSISCTRFLSTNEHRISFISKHCCCCCCYYYYYYYTVQGIF